MHYKYFACANNVILQDISFGLVHNLVYPQKPECNTKYVKIIQRRKELFKLHVIGH